MECFILSMRENCCGEEVYPCPICCCTQLKIVVAIGWVCPDVKNIVWYVSVN